jgi:sugar phosphate permease
VTGVQTCALPIFRAAALGTPASLVPVLWTVLHLSKMTWAWLGGRLGDRVDRGRLLQVAWLVFIVAMLGNGLATEAWHVWAVTLLGGAWQGIAEPVQKALVSSFATAQTRGRVFGVLNGLKGAAAVPAGLLFGLVWERLDAATAFFGSAAVGALASTLLFGWRRAATPPQERGMKPP